MIKWFSDATVLAHHTYLRVSFYDPIQFDAAAVDPKIATKINVVLPGTAEVGFMSRSWLYLIWILATLQQATGYLVIGLELQGLPWTLNKLWGHMNDTVAIMVIQAAHLK